MGIENKVEVVVTDLDGTLLRSNRSFSIFDRQTLIQLGNKNVVRVIATGRSVYSAKKVLAADFPIDFLIFSSGAGIMNWNNQKMLFDSEFTVAEVHRIMDVLADYSVDFMIHRPAPDNHRFQYCQTESPHPDFLRRLELYQGFASPIQKVAVNHCASQFVLILEQDKALFDDISERLAGSASVIRATSPLDHKTMWIEIFPLNVSKGKAFDWLCKLIRVDVKKSLGVGNDYNDWDLLMTTGNSFVVANAPVEMQCVFEVTADHNSSGFTQAVKQFF